MSAATRPILAKMTVAWCYLLVGFAAIAVVRVHCQLPDTQGFISIDCGIEEGSTYSGPTTHLTYVSDGSYIDSGVIANISREYVTDLMEQQARAFLNVRSFPISSRNCYDITGVTMGSKYLLRATFMYGNYDGLNSRSISFDLYLGVNLWKTINLTDPAAIFWTEALAVAVDDAFSVCLVNTGKGTPFVSSMDVRPLRDGLYPEVNASRSVVVHQRLNMGPTSGSGIVRYPDDKYDRLWDPYINTPVWAEISTNSTVNNLAIDYFEAPSVVMQTAVTPANSRNLDYSWKLDPGDLSELFAILYFSELLTDLTRTGNMSRQFYVYLNDFLWYNQPFSPDLLLNNYIYGLNPITGYQQYNLTIQALSNSTLPPILNAMEILTRMGDSNVATNSEDADAILTIKESYQIKRNWRGDPCSPRGFAWDGINCTFSSSDPPRITNINVSSSGLTGTISTAFASLGSIQYLDLSNNNITGTIPGFLGRLSSLKLLDLTNNNFTGPIPSELLTEAQNGLLTLRLEGNPYLCSDGSSCQLIASSTKRKISTPVIVILCVLSFLLLVLVVFLVWRYRKKKGYGIGNRVKQQKRPIFNQIQKHQDSQLQFENRQFTYLELKDITNNFNRVLGVGGFGTVYYGCLTDGIEVAVKMRSQSASQGPREFLSEALFLTRVHHKNLVSMVGHCKDGNYMGLVYEYMAQGTVRDHLKGKTQNATSLSWQQRLQIAVESAQGLEYLHTACKPPIIHRDVKTANILLSERFEAKIADFGISKTISEVNTHVSTLVMGTPGYLDPEYHITNQLSSKSDVYSFGVVILELVTGQAPIVTSTDKAHISVWVRQRLTRGSIEDVVDPRLQREYDVNSAWKCIDTALGCLARAPQARPTMGNVVAQLKSSLELENLRLKNGNYVASSQTMFTPR